MHDEDESIRLESALTKHCVRMTSTDVCSKAMQIYGGIGYTSEMRVSRCRQFAGGTNEIMVRIAGRQIVEKYA